jgi:hypothetical protein
MRLATNRVLALSGAAFGLVLILYLGVLRPGGRSDVQGPAHPQEQQEGKQVAQQPAPSERIAAEATSPPQEPTAEEVLEDYWGARWPEVREALIAEGRDLSAPLVLTPWEEHSQAVYEQIFHFSEEDLAQWKDRLLRWPAELTSQWLSENELLAANTELTPVELLELSDLAAGQNAEIEWKIDDYLTLLAVEHQRRWETQEFQRAPCSTAGLPEQGNAFFGSAVASGPWTARIALTATENPDLYARNNEIFALVRQRNNAIRALIKDQRNR